MQSSMVLRILRSISLVKEKNILRQAQIQTYKATDVKKCSLSHEEEHSVLQCI